MCPSLAAGSRTGRSYQLFQPARLFISGWTGGSLLLKTSFLPLMAGFDRCWRLLETLDFIFAWATHCILAGCVFSYSHGQRIVYLQDVLTGYVSCTLFTIRKTMEMDRQRIQHVCILGIGNHSLVFQLQSRVFYIRYVSSAREKVHWGFHIAVAHPHSRVLFSRGPVRRTKHAR